METKNRQLRKSGIKVESVDTACGEIPHMTVDQLAARLDIASRELRCPACGRVHLTEEDVKNAEGVLFSDTQRFKQIKNQAEGSE
jgi:hypothetical protein